MKNEYPRPQFQRKNYQILNGIWDFEFDDNDDGIMQKYYINHIFSKKIVVPFSFQCEESKVHTLERHEIMWYQRFFDIDESLINQNLLLCFNAVDYECDVFLNGRYIGNHKGGYTFFSIDISKFVKKRNNKLTLRVKDSFRPYQPRGKQYFDGKYSRCWYNSNSGIWQSVWIESFSDNCIKRCLITPDIDTNSVKFEIETLYQKDSTLNIKVSYKGKDVKNVNCSLDRFLTEIVIKIEESDFIDELHFWDVDNPNLYDVDLTLSENGEVNDSINTYFGFRKIEVRDNEIYLNNKKLYQKLILDQGYFPTSDITSLDPLAFKEDIQLAKEMGFNGARKHQKIEDPYFYYYADKLGFLVWAEIPSAYYFSTNEVNEINQLIIESVNQLYNFPSIICWVPFNESWGIRKALLDSKQKNFMRNAYFLIKTLDLTRLVDTNDGWEQINETDFIAIHDYDPIGDSFCNKFLADNLNFVQPIGRKLISYGETYNNQPLLLTEYGGLCITKDVGKDFYGYGILSSEQDFYDALNHLQQNVYKSKLNGFCYTQLTDVKQETNGLLDANHKPKYDTKIIKKIIGGNYDK